MRCDVEKISKGLACRCERVMHHVLDSGATGHFTTEEGTLHTHQNSNQPSTMAGDPKNSRVEAYHLKQHESWMLQLLGKDG